MTAAPAGPPGSAEGQLRTAGPGAQTADLLDTLAQASLKVPLTPEEAGYVEAARAANTLRGYRRDWREWTSWWARHGHELLPAPAPAVTGHLTDLARHGAKVGTMSRRLSAIKFAQLRDLPDQTQSARRRRAGPQGCSIKGVVALLPSGLVVRAMGSVARPRSDAWRLAAAPRRPGRQQHSRGHVPRVVVRPS